MWRVLFAVGMLFAVVGCSSSDDDVPACSIPGTYTMTGNIQQSTAGCSAFGTTTPQTTVTISSAGASTYSLEFAGLTGSCTATATETCKVQAKCDLSAPGTLQVVWTFTSSGFTGTNIGALSASTTLPQGCNYTAAATATKL